MSKGLGSLQRRLIEISTATKTIWLAMPGGIKVNVEDTVEKTACGITTRSKAGWTWKGTGEPYCVADAVIQSREHLLELQAAFRNIYVVNRSPDDSILCACWSMHHIRATLWPDLWKHGDNREELRLNHYYFPQIPPDIKKGRNTAQAGLSRAITSMEKRGMILAAGYTQSEAASAIWKSHGGSYNHPSKFHCVSYILDPQLLRHRATDIPPGA